ncbi:MAG: winged helix-turn-helix domain-containing protein [Nitrososphaeria archaeon]
MKEKESYQTQRRTAKTNENKILKALLSHPKTFTELRNEVGLSQTGLSKVLKRLSKSGLIKKVMYSRAYELTSKGKRTVMAIPMMLDSIEEIMSGKHSYRNVIGKYRSGYKGISYDIMHNELGNSKLLGLFENTFEKTLSNFEKDIGKIPDIVENESELEGKIVFAITLDFDDMLKRFKLFKKRKTKDYRFLGMEWEN